MTRLSEKMLGFTAPQQHSAPQISKTVLKSNSAPWSRGKHSESRTQEFHSEIFYTIPNAQKATSTGHPAQIC